MVKKLTRREFLIATAGIALGAQALTWKKLVLAQPVDPKLERQFKELLPEAAEFKPVVEDKKVVFYEAYDKAGTLIGYPFVTKAYGPSESFKVIGIVSLDYKVTAIDVIPYLEHLLNPKLVEPEFEDQFIGLSVKELSLSPDGEIDAATGATISAGAITYAIKRKVDAIIQK